MNAKNVCARIVIQSADREARLALSSLRELRRYGRDVEMFIFPDEYHVKWQPAHRRATYLRSLDELERWSQSVPTRCVTEHQARHQASTSQRSEERSVGKAGVSTCRSRWSPVH